MPFLRQLLGLAIAILTVALALLVRAALDPLLGDRQPFCTLYPAVAATAWFAGFRSSLLTMILGSLAADWCFASPRYQIGLSSPDDLIGLLIFTVCSVALGLFTAAWRAERDTTSRQAVAQQEALRERDDQLRLITDAVPALISYIDAEYRYQLGNATYERWFGLSTEQIRGRHVREVLGEQSWPTVKLHLDRALAGEEVRYELVLALRDRGPRSLSVSYTPDRGPDGVTVRGVVVMVHDNTEHRAAEEALRRSEGMLALAQRMAHLGSWELDLANQDVVNANSLRWSEETYRLFGYEPGTVAVTNDLFFQAVHPDDRTAIVAAVAEAVRQRKPYEIEHRIFRADGAQRIVHQWAEIVLDSGGRPLRLVGTCQDVTERRLAEGKALEAGRQLQLITDTMPAFVSRCDRQRRFVWVNKRYSERFGLTPEQVAGRPIAEVLGEEVYAILEGYIDRVLQGEPVEYEAAIPYRGLERRWMQVRYAPTYGADGLPDGWVAAITDVHDRKMAEEALKEADRRKDEFLATLAHELRNPLAPIRSAVEILQTDFEGRSLDPDLRRARDVIERQVGHLVRLVDDLLDVGRINRGKIALHKEVVDLSVVVERALETSRPLVESAGHQLQVSLPSEALPVEADPVRLAQVLANLLNNAAKYTPPGGVIHLTAEPLDDQAVVVKVRDNGLGIPPEMLSRVFDLFTQVDTSITRAQGGLGIGLTLVQRLVEMHGGRVEAHSEGLGKGSEFVVWLPLAGNRNGLHVPLATRGPLEVRPRRVLIVDDNRDSADSLALFLELAGNIVRTGYDGLEALRTAREFHPEVVLLDIGMPGMSGYEVARELRQHPDTRAALLVALTGWGQEEDRRLSREAGFDHHLVKPAEPQMLRELLAHSVGGNPVPGTKGAEEERA